jgi:hypothetical protein
MITNAQTKKSSRQESDQEHRSSGVTVADTKISDNGQNAFSSTAAGSKILRTHLREVAYLLLNDDLPTVNNSKNSWLAKRATFPASS